MLATIVIRMSGESEEYLSMEEDIKKKLISTFQTEDITCLPAVKRGHWILHLLDSGSDALLHGYSYIEQCCRLLTGYFSMMNCSVVFGIGHFAFSLDDFPDSYETAVAAAWRGFYWHPGHVCYYKDSAHRYDTESFSMSEFAHALRKETPLNAVFIVKSLTSEIKTHEDTLIVDVLRFFFGLIKKLIETGNKDGLVVFDTFPTEQDIWTHINKFAFIDELCEFLVEAINRYYELAKLDATDNAIVNNIIRFIKQNYGNAEFSITMVSEHMNLSPTYLCHLFKETTGDTLNNYLIDIRIKRALELLQTGEYKVKDIARLVGYRNGNYFSYQFKKRMGYSPSDQNI
jgi:two-component system response regulator YesN